MTDLDLSYLPATDAIKRFKAKTLSPAGRADPPGGRGRARY